MSAPARRLALPQAAALAWAAMARGERVFGAVREREGRGTWRIDVRPHGWIYGVGGVPFRSRELADAVLGQIRIEIARGTPVADALEPWLPRTAKRAPVLGRYEDWLAGKWRQVEAGDRSPRTVQEYARYARDGGELAFWDGLSVYEIDAANLEDWHGWLADRGTSPALRRKVLGAFRVFCSWLVRRGVLPSAPPFPAVPTTDHEPQTLSAEQQARVLAAIPAERRGIFLALALLGIRPGEARALDAADLYEDAGEPWIRVSRAMQGLGAGARIGPTKTRRRRALPIPAPLAEWIEAHVEPGARLAGAPLFPHPGGGRWSHGALRDTWMRACREAGVRAGLYEGTKHTAATEWLRQGASERAIQAILGHSDVRSTRRYAQLGRAAVVEVLRPRRPE